MVVGRWVGVFVSDIRTAGGWDFDKGGRELATVVGVQRLGDLRRLQLCDHSLHLGVHGPVDVHGAGSNGQDFDVFQAPLFRFRFSRQFSSAQ